MNFSSASETEKVRRYLLQQIVRSGSKPVRLPTEMSMVKTLGSSRVTVRRAISDLLKGHYIQKLPGKRGIYSNPAMVDVTMHSIAILQKSSYLDCRFLSILGAMGDELQRQNCLCSLNFFQSGNDSFENIAAELEISGFDCILVNTCHSDAGKFLKKGLPVLLLEIPGFFNKWKENSISFDNFDFGTRVAQTMIRRNLKKVLFFSDLADIREGFCAAGEKHLEIESFENILDRNGLKKILCSGKFSGIAAMTREVGLRTLYDVLAELPDIPKPELFLFPWKESEFFKRDNPQFYTEIFDPQAFLDQLQELGRIAAKGVMQMINDLPVDVSPVKLQK